MKIHDVTLNEDAEAGDNTVAGNFANVTGSIGQIRRRNVVPKPKKKAQLTPVKESIEKMNPDDPMNPEIYIQGYGVMSLKGVQGMIVRELKELATRAERGDMENVQYLLKNAPLMSKIDAVVTALEELEQKRRRGGSNSRGIEKR